MAEILNILHLQPKINLACGVSRVIFQLMSSSADDQQHIVGTFGGDGLTNFKKHMLTVKRFFGGKNSLLIPLHAYQIYRLCKENNIGLIHAHHRYFDFTGRIAASALKIPLLTSVHSKVESQKLFSYKADEFVVPSLAIKRHVTDTFSIDSKIINVIPNFVTASDYEKKSMSEISKLKFKYRIPEGRAIILFAGRLSKEKGVDILLRAVRSLMFEFSDIALVLVGSGEMKEYVAKRIGDKMPDTVLVESQENITPFYQMADIVVLPSRVDPAPLVVIEAGLMNKPVAAANVDGIPEMITHGETGILFEKDSVEGLMDALRCLLDDASLQRRLADNLHKKIMQESLHIHKMQDYHNLYKRIAGRA